MYKLHITRVINSQHVDLVVGEYSLEVAALVLQTQFFLSAYCVDDQGKKYNLVENDYTDNDGCEYVNFSFVPELR